MISIYFSTGVAILPVAERISEERITESISSLLISKSAAATLGFLFCRVYFWVFWAVLLKLLDLRKRTELVEIPTHFLQIKSLVCLLFKDKFLFIYIDTYFVKIQASSQLFSIQQTIPLSLSTCNKLIFMFFILGSK